MITASRLTPQGLPDSTGHRILRVGGVGPVNSLNGLERLDNQDELTLEVYRTARCFLVRLQSGN